MKRVLGSLVALAVAVTVLGALPTAAGAAATASAARAERVLVTNDLAEDDLFYRPHRFYLSGDGTFGMTAVRWRSYGGAVARATATAYVNDCRPSCAAGRVHHPRATVRLSKVVECGGQPIYARLGYRLAGDVPAGFPRRGLISMVPRAGDGNFEC